MALWFKGRTSQILLLTVGFWACGLAGTPVALTQRLPKETGREPGNKPPSSRRENRPKRQTAPAPSKNSASAEAASFLNLGDRFREQKKWNAAEAAYREAVNVWPANVDALMKLGVLYLDTNKLDEAQRTYNELRSVSASHASNLLAEINGYKAKLAH